MKNLNRPLLISDCDEVLLHMMRHFGAWLDSEHRIDFVPQAQELSQSMRYRHDGTPVNRDHMWTLLEAFFITEMHRQTLAPYVTEALGKIGEVADIVILTNIGNEHHARRVAQLDAVGIRHEVLCNVGGKGRPVARLMKERRPVRAVFVDDLPVHHESVAEHAPEVWRLHMIVEPEIARLIPPAPQAHKRIDSWRDATDWVIDRLVQG